MTAIRQPAGINDICYLEEMWKIRQAASLVRHMLTAKRPRYLHTPYWSELLAFAMDMDRHYYAFDEIEAIRLELKRLNPDITTVDYGAGSSRRLLQGTNTLRRVLGSAVSPPSKSQLLFRLVLWARPRYILELGTSAGISTAYMARAAPGAEIFTLEGNPDLVRVARGIASTLHAGNIQFIEGNFDDTLQGVLGMSYGFDFVYLDGNHAYEPTLRYFNLIEHHLTTDALVLVDDIRWSAEMWNAWNAILQNPAVKSSVDCFSYGIVSLSHRFKSRSSLKVTPSISKPLCYQP